MRRSSFLVVMVLSCATIAPHPARAQSASTDNAGAHFDRGVTFYGEGDFAAALVEFKRAYALAPAWQVLFNVGQSYYQLHDYANALVTFQRFVSEGADRIAPKQRATVDGELAELSNRVGKAIVVSNQDGASVSIDDQPVGVTPLRDPVLVSAGIRKVTATREGYAPIERRVSVSSGEVVKVDLGFVGLVATTAPPSSVSTAPSRVAADAPPVRRPDRVSAYVAFAIGGAGLVTGAVFGALAWNDKSSLDGVCVDKACPPSSQSNIDALSRSATIGTLGFGVALAGALAGSVLWLTAGPPAGRERSASVTGATYATTEALTVHFGPGFAAGTF